MDLVLLIGPSDLIDFIGMRNLLFRDIPPRATPAALTHSLIHSLTHSVVLRCCHSSVRPSVRPARLAGVGIAPEGFKALFKEYVQVGASVGRGALVGNSRTVQPAVSAVERAPNRVMCLSFSPLALCVGSVFHANV